MKLKVCGMKYKDNLEAILALKPDYIGFIFYRKSDRFYDGEYIPFPENIQKAGVFVNESFAEITRIIYRHKLDVVQLHGDETDGYCNELKQYYPELKIWKAFAVNQDFDWEIPAFYCAADAFLFDAKGEKYGGNGFKFDWEMLGNYKLELDKEIILSGGISEDDIPLIYDLQKQIPQLKTVDINSRFEIKTGLKDVELVKCFYEKLKLIR